MDIRQILLLIMLQMVCISLCYKNYYVKSNNDGQCPDNPCHNLSYYLDHPHFFQSNTTFYFLQGIHTIEKSDSIMIKSVSHLTFSGYKKKILFNDSAEAAAKTLGKVVINCTGRFGFFFVDTTSVLITSITLSHCGTVHVNEFDTTYFSTAITFVESSNIRVADVIIQNSTGFALFIHNGLGNSQILGSKFISNGGDYGAGGNVYLNYHLTEDRCDLKSIYFNIESSKFIQGANFYPIDDLFATGFNVALYHSCVDIHVNFDNVYMFDNINLLRGGGNIGITVIEPHNTTGRHHIAIRNSRIEEGVAYSGGGVSLLVGNEFIDQASKDITHFPPNSLIILNTSIISNTAIVEGGGFFCFIESLQMYNFTFKESLFSKNKVYGELDSIYGNMGFSIRFRFPGPSHFFVIEKCIFQSGVSYRAAGFGLTVWFFSHVYTIPGNDDLNNQHPKVQVLILNSQFINNFGMYGGLEICIYLYDPVEGHTNLPAAKGTIKLHNCTFRDNSGYLGSSLSYITYDTSLFYSSIHSEVTFYLENVVFQYDRKPDTSNMSNLLKSRTAFIAVVVMDNAQNVTFSNCKFYNNNATGLLAENSKIYFNGNITFFNNSGWNGGALALHQSYILPWNNTNIYFYKNYAKNRGGALFIQQWGVAFVRNLCFIQPVILPGPEINIAIFFEDNTAEVAGHVLYGGYIEKCHFLPNSKSLKQPQSGEIFDHLFNYTTQTGISVITSDPIGVCFCANGIPNCKKKNLTKRVFPGETFNVAAAVIGQRDGVVPGVARASFVNINLPEQHSLDDGQYSQATRSCTNLIFSIFSEQKMEQLELFVENSDPAYESTFHSPLITADLLECPPGFALSGMPARCNCASVLLNNGYRCNIHGQTIYHPGGVWIGCSFSLKEKCGVILHTHCPLNYCKQEGTELNLQQPDLQCALNHSGILCGKCQPGLSLALGTSKCLKCSNAFISLLLVFLLVGLVLVVLLSWCNLTVSEGTLSALILYVNIIQVSRPVFLMNVLTVFVAWLNLDFGIQTCFYNGMDMYAKAWLQFVFPLYIWVLVAVMIILSHYYTTAARLVGQNAPKVLATLFLFSYAKLLRAVITVFSFTYLVYPDGHSKAVWLHDGNVDYLRGKHIPLFIAAVLILMVFVIPYTFVVFFMQCLRRKSGNRLLFWVRRLKPIFDPYGGPYKDRYQFWTGLLLMARVVLLLAVAFNSSGNPAIIPLAVSIIVLILLCIQMAAAGVYKRHILDILEASFLLNVGTLSVTALYAQLVSGNVVAPTLTSTGIALATFSLILAYHIYKYTPVNKIWVNSLHKFQTRRATDIPMYVRNSQSNENSDTQYREMEIQPVRPPSRVNVHRLTYGEDGELMLVTDD